MTAAMQTALIVMGVGHGFLSLSRGVIIEIGHRACQIMIAGLI
jgi:hypothetical protein